ncbi:hypothetical protein BDY21DRAFT_367545 [Lineolata rhizophorae]|uniref:Uncharacterized protein n=1 Tax=Lineolata rhizophorae TaxID=578093 RepID=A0A6A6NNB4_9PEZI|nr:hypothetical protein BDY21DRAFT_367545 [Lineolata rhizophorae]
MYLAESNWLTAARAGDGTVKKSGPCLGCPRLRTKEGEWGVENYLNAHGKRKKGKKPLRKPHQRQQAGATRDTPGPQPSGHSANVHPASNYPQQQKRLAPPPAAAAAAAAALLLLAARGLSPRGAPAGAAGARARERASEGRGWVKSAKRVDLGGCVGWAQRRRGGPAGPPQGPQRALAAALGRRRRPAGGVKRPFLFFVRWAPALLAAAAVKGPGLRATVARCVYRLPKLANTATGGKGLPAAAAVAAADGRRGGGGG